MFNSTHVKKTKCKKHIQVGFSKKWVNKRFSTSIHSFHLYPDHAVKNNVLKLKILLQCQTSTDEWAILWWPCCLQAYSLVSEAVTSLRWCPFMQLFDYFIASCLNFILGQWKEKIKSAGASGNNCLSQILMQ